MSVHYYITTSDHGWGNSIPREASLPRSHEAGMMLVEKNGME